MNLRQAARESAPEAELAIGFCVLCTPKVADLDGISKTGIYAII